MDLMLPPLLTLVPSLSPSLAPKSALSMLRLRWRIPLIPPLLSKDRHRGSETSVLSTAPPISPVSATPIGPSRGRFPPPPLLVISTTLVFVARLPRAPATTPPCGRSPSPMHPPSPPSLLN